MQTIQEQQREQHFAEIEASRRWRSWSAFEAASSLEDLLIALDRSDLARIAGALCASVLEIAQAEGEHRSAFASAAKADAEKFELAEKTARNNTSQ